MLLTFAVATQQGVTELAVLQVGIALYSLLAFILDSLAIAGQAMIGHGLGVGDRERVRLIARRLVRFGLLAGVAIGLVVAALAPVLGAVFTSDPAVRAQLVPVVLVLAIALPLSGFVFVLDGVLIGAGDGRYLAIAGIATVVGYLPLLWFGQASFVALWIAFCVGYIGLRALTLGLRVRGEAWLTR
jgi:Na+-driven multidrug efflux pump